MPEPRDPCIGERIATQRQARHMTQGVLATLTGIPRVTLVRIEQGHQSVYAERLRTLAEALGVSSDYLLGLNGHAEAPHG